MSKIRDIMGQRFGRLVAVTAKEFKGNNRMWECVCDCGNMKNISLGNLKNGCTKSCGCFRKEHTTQVKTTHGLRHTRFCIIFYKIRTRCKDVNDKDYGGRKIKNEWNSVEEFRDDMFESYNLHVQEFGEKNTTIDRINVNGNYCKENCRWATMKVQQRNRRNNSVLEYLGENKPLIEFAEQYGINFKTVKTRIYQMGWSAEKALTTPVRK